jgi:hypothetical protein
LLKAGDTGNAVVPAADCADTDLGGTIGAVVTTANPSRAVDAAVNICRAVVTVLNSNELLLQVPIYAGEALVFGIPSRAECLYACRSEY